MALRKILILRRLAQRGLEGRTTPIQVIVDFLTPSKAGTQAFSGLWIPALRFATAGMTNWDGGGLFRHPY
jgi:hypothetical protein